MSESNTFPADSTFVNLVLPFFHVFDYENEVLSKVRLRYLAELF